MLTTLKFSDDLQFAVTKRGMTTTVVGRDNLFIMITYISKCIYTMI